MARTPRIIGLRDFGLTLAALSRLGPRPARLSIQLTGETTSKLRYLRPKQRDAALRETPAKQLDRLRHEFPLSISSHAGRTRLPGRLTRRCPQNRVVALASRRHVNHVMLDT